MTVEHLRKLLQSYDFENSGDLNKIEWTKLCSSSTINLSSELSSTLFNELDTDKDGLIKISDILQELQIWETMNRQGGSVDQINTIEDNNNNDVTDELIGRNLDDNDEKLNMIEQQINFSSITRSVILERRKHKCSLIPSEINLQLEGNDQWMPKKETTSDGSEVFTATPILRTPRYSSVCELENVITQNYPELISPFKIVLEDFRKDLLQTKREKTKLEETYMKEKAARKNDLDRLEGELESQIKSIEERAKSEVHQKLQNEYRALVCNKEQEITEIREQVETLRRKINHHSTVSCDSMNTSITSKTCTEVIDTSNCYYTQPKPSTITSDYYHQNRNEDAEQKLYKIELESVLSALIQREAELRTLKDQLAKQEAQLTIDKRELINQEEEKQNLYSQLNVMRTTMERLNQTNDYLCTALHHGSFSRRSRNSPSCAFSEFMEQSDNNEGNALTFRLSSGNTFPLEPYEFDSLEKVLPQQQQHDHRPHHDKNSSFDLACRQSDYSSENVSSVSAFNYEKNNFYSVDNNNEEVESELGGSKNQQHVLSASFTPTRIFKVIMVGDSGVGKSSFSYRFCDGVFYPHLRATLGVDFRTKNIRMNNSVYTIQLWDTAGQETYRCIIRSYFRKIDGVILMYAVNQTETFANIKYWMETIKECTSDIHVPVLLVGNKIDLRDAQAKDEIGQDENSQKLCDMISYEMGDKLAKLHQVLFIETSVLSKHNVTEAIELLTKEMKLTEDNQVAVVTLTSSLNRMTTDSKQGANKTTGCCR